MGAGMDHFSKAYVLSDEEFTKFKNLVYKIVGINLNDTKKMLLISRLSKRLRVLGLSNFSDYYDYLVAEGARHDELNTFVNLITTNKTDFFREQHHFDLLSSQVLPRLAQRVRRGQQKNIRIWSAGCSTGEEPYTMAMVVQEFLRTSGERLDIRILATDIDTSVLAHAQAGIYRRNRISGVANEYLQRYFHNHDGESLVVDNSLKAMIRFGRFNIMHDFPFKFGFDVIFCRNVLIYFSPQDRKHLVAKYCSVLRPDGCLALGHSESLVVDSLPLRSLGTTFYQLKGEHHA
jgi:chemotaxis protein methyltransferase CheR